METESILRRLLGSGRWTDLAIDGIQLAILALFLLLIRITVFRVTERTADQIARRGGERQAGRVRTLMGLARSVADFLLGFLLTVNVLGRVGINVTAIIGTASVAGLAVGFGAQKLIKDLITGFILLLEDQYAVGETVTIGTVTGTVEELGMRVTRIRDADGRVHILSNGDIAIVCNHSRGPIRAVLELGIAAQVAPSDATKALEAPLQSVSNQLALAENAHVEGVAATDATKTTLRIVYRLHPGQDSARVAATLRQAARDALVDAGIPLG